MITVIPVSKNGSLIVYNVQLTLFGFHIYTKERKAYVVKADRVIPRKPTEPTKYLIVDPHVRVLSKKFTTVLWAYWNEGVY